jgi:succinyl-CoA synthetase alpha subunit
LYVKREARRALEKGLNLLIFSDNVPIEDELELKKLAQEKNLLVMGPDCGTAFIGGAALGFANQVRRGSIGIVAAAGTGLQEVATLIDRLGQGISHGIGTGSHDVSEAIGAITMIQGLRMLANDNATKVIGIVSKPPSQTVMKKVMAEVKRIAKPVVVNFLDGDPSSVLDAEKFFAPTLESAAILCVSLAQGESMDVVRTNLLKGVNLDTIAKKARHGMGPSQKYVRGLFAGGTFCSEACVLLRDTFQDIYTNINVQGTMKLPDPRQSLAHTCVDMGDDIFTIGKPHPMLEQSVRINRFKKEAQDPQTAVIFLDIVLGHGVHPDPGGEFAETIREGIDLSAKAGRKLCVIANVCGTENDPQIRSVQVSKLEAAGVIVMPSNAQGIRLAMKVVEGKQ